MVECRLLESPTQLPNSSEMGNVSRRAREGITCVEFGVYCKLENGVISHMQQMSSFVNRKFLKFRKVQAGTKRASVSGGGSRKLLVTLLYCRALPHGDSSCPPSTRVAVFPFCASQSRALALLRRYRRPVCGDVTARKRKGKHSGLQQSADCV